LTPCGDIHRQGEDYGRNEAKKMAQAKIRPFINQYLRFPPVSGQYRGAMGIHNHDTVHGEASDRAALTGPFGAIMEE
jgi:hypothetical protein